VVKLEERIAPGGAMQLSLSHCRECKTQ
jgi:hypothetical protein